MGNLSTPTSVQKLQTALHAKAKAEAGYRFYALYDKISRKDILAYAYAQCRSNKDVPGVDGQDFADIEAYGVQRPSRLARAGHERPADRRQVAAAFLWSSAWLDCTMRRAPARAPTIDDARIEAATVRTLESCPENATHWSSRDMAKTSVDGAAHLAGLRAPAEAKVLVVTCLAVLSALAICAGMLVVRIYEWRQDVLHGPYIDRDHPHGKIKD